MSFYRPAAVSGFHRHHFKLYRPAAVPGGYLSDPVTYFVVKFLIGFRCERNRLSGRQQHFEREISMCPLAPNGNAILPVIIVREFYFALRSHHDNFTGWFRIFVTNMNRSHLLRHLSHDKFLLSNRTTFLRLLPLGTKIRVIEHRQELGSLSEVVQRVAEFQAFLSVLNRALPIAQEVVRLRNIREDVGVFRCDR